MAVGDAYVFPGFLTPVLTQLLFPKPPTTFLACFCRTSVLAPNMSVKENLRDDTLTWELHYGPHGYKANTLPHNTTNKVYLNPIPHKTAF